MSGHAANALVTRRIEDSSEPYLSNRVGKPIPPGQRIRFLDSYLSWMSPDPFKTCVLNSIDVRGGTVKSSK